MDPAAQDVLDQPLQPGEVEPVAAALAAAAAAPVPWDGTPDPGISSAPSPRVDTGRLYRSAGAKGPATLDAIPAIDPGYVPTRSAAVDVVPDRPVIQVEDRKGILADVSSKIAGISKGRFDGKP